MTKRITILVAFTLLMVVNFQVVLDSQFFSSGVIDISNMTKVAMARGEGDTSCWIKNRKDR